VFGLPDTPFQFEKDSELDELDVPIVTAEENV
jgi:hypothetical protein